MATKPEKEKWLRLKGKQIEIVRQALSNERALKVAGMPHHTVAPKKREEVIEVVTELEKIEKQLKD